MFSTVYQNGEYGIEIFAPSGNEPFKMCKLSNENNIKKVYDRSIKGYMAALEKESSSTFLQIPRSSKSSLGITQPLLIFQIQLHPEKSFTLELILVDSDRQKRRFHLSTNFKEVDANNLHVCIPWAQPDRDQWTNVAINLIDLITSFSPPGSNLTYFGLESFSIQPVCRLRKIFTLPLKYLGDEDTGLLIPPKYDFTTGVEAGSWVFSYALPTTSAKNTAIKDQEAGAKTSKLPSKATSATEGAKGGDLMGIVGKKVPRQEPAASKTTSTVSKNDAASGDESALKRQKAVPVAPTATAQPPSNPWATAATTAPTPLKKSHKRDETNRREDVQMVVTIEEPMDVDIEKEQKEENKAPAAKATPLPFPALPAGGIKLSSKLKQKLGSGAPPATTVPAPLAVSDSIDEEDEMSPIRVAENTTASPEPEPVRAVSPPVATAHADVSSLVNQESNATGERPSTAVTTPPRQQQHTHHNVRGSVDESVVLASQDLSAMEDFVKNYHTQQDTLQGYASFARVDSEVAQLTNKLSSATTSPETRGAAKEGVASSGLKDFMQQVRKHERTPSRGKKFADVALSPMPVMPTVEEAGPVTARRSSEDTNAGVDGIARYGQHDEELVERSELDSHHQSRPPTATAPATVLAQSRPGTADHQSKSNSRAPSRPSTATPQTQEEVIAMHLRLPTPPPTPQPASRPPTAPSAESAPTLKRDQDPALSSRPTTASSRPSTARLSAAQLESALMSPYSEAISYFEQGKKSQDFSSQQAHADISAEATHDAENEAPTEPAVSFFEQYQERSAAIGQQFTEDIDSLLEKLSHPLPTIPTAAVSKPPATTTTSGATTGSAALGAALSPSALATPLPERKKRAIRARVASLLLQVEQAEMEYIAEFGFEAFEQEVGFFEEKTRSRQ